MSQFLNQISALVIAPLDVFEPPARGVQYVHCVMRKCIMVKLGGKRKTHQVCKKHVNFTK